VLKRFDPQIDLGHLETGNFKAEVETGQRKVLELLREQPVIPGGNLSEPVVGDHESAGLRPGEVIQTQRRHLGKAKRVAGRQPTMSGNRMELSIDQNRNIKTECRNAAGELTNLLPAVLTGVSRIRLDLLDRAVDDFEALLAPFTPIRRFTH